MCNTKLVTANATACRARQSFKCTRQDAPSSTNYQQAHANFLARLAIDRNHPKVVLAMAHADTRAESARIGTILETAPSISPPWNTNSPIMPTSRTRPTNNRSEMRLIGSIRHPLRSHLTSTFQRAAPTSSTHTHTAAWNTTSLRALRRQRRWRTGTSASLSSTMRSRT